MSRFPSPRIKRPGHDETSGSDYSVEHIGRTACSVVLLFPSPEVSGSESLRMDDRKFHAGVNVSHTPHINHGGRVDDHNHKSMSSEIQPESPSLKIFSKLTLYPAKKHSATLNS